MKTKLGMVAAAAGLAAAAWGGAVSAGGQKHKHHNYGGYAAEGNTVVVSCYRGPWNQVIWDRPNAVFFDSLVNIGYDAPEAHAIAERICRDQDLVGNLESMRDEVIRVIRSAPRHGQRRHSH